MKKLIILITVIITFFVFFLYMYLSPRNYEKKYEINNVKITEIYYKEQAYYYFNLKYKNKDFEYITKEDYSTKRGLIDKVKITEKKGIICLTPSSKHHDTTPICYKEKEQVVYTLAGNEPLEQANYIDSYYDGTTINYLNGKTFLTWNYKYFDYINIDEMKKIEILTKDNYNLDLVAQVGKYLIVPDYDSKHTFKLIYIINFETGKLEKWNLKYEIDFDSYIVGTEGKSFFIFDKKNKIEYELRPDTKKMRKVKYKAIVDGKWKNITLGDLNKELKFSNASVYNYEIINKKLYLEYLNGKNKILISEKEVKDIIKVENDTIYYIVDDQLYMYNPYYGEVSLMINFEWNFNYKNLIYIY